VLAGYVKGARGTPTTTICMPLYMPSAYLAYTRVEYLSTKEGSLCVYLCCLTC